MNNNNQQHVKTYNANSKSKNRIKFSSSKQRAKQASADVYRSYKRKHGTAASREERVHHPEHFREYDSAIGAAGKRKKLKGGEEDKAWNGGKVTRVTHVTNQSDQFRYKDGASQTAIVKISKQNTRKATKDQIMDTGYHDDDDDDDDKEEEEDEMGLLHTKTTFGIELDLCKSRNGSQIFARLYRQLFPLVQSLPETLHHAKKIIHLLLMYLLSPHQKPNMSCEDDEWMQEFIHGSGKAKAKRRTKQMYIVNLATADVLHLLAVLARDLRHEIHPFVHDLILPRIIQDLINPPTTTTTATAAITTVATTSSSSTSKEVGSSNDEIVLLNDEEEDDGNGDGNGNGGKASVEEAKMQQRSFDISIVEAAFRAISYILKYDSQEIVKETTSNATSNSTSPSSTEGCLELMRKHYGATVAHKQAFVRKLAAETFAPMIRKLRSNTARKKHVRRVVKSLASSAVVALEQEMKHIALSATTGTTITTASSLSNFVIPPRLEKARNDAVEGVGRLLFHVARGVPGRLHSKGSAIIKIVINCLSLIEASEGSNAMMEEGEKDEEKEKQKLLEQYRNDMIYRVISTFIYNVRGHIQKTSNFAPVWDEFYSYADNLVSGKKMNSSALNQYIQLLNESVAHGCGRLLRSDENVIQDENAQELSNVLNKLLGKEIYGRACMTERLSTIALLCSAWKVFPDHPSFTSQLSHFIKCITTFQDVTTNGRNGLVDPLLVLAKDLLPCLSRELAVKKILPAIIHSAANRCHRSQNDDGLSPLQLLHTVATCLLLQSDADIAQDSDNLFYVEKTHSCSIPFKEKDVLIEYVLKHNLAFDNDDSIQTDYAHMGTLVSIIPFITLIGYDEYHEDKHLSIVKKVCDWILNQLKMLCGKSDSLKNEKNHSFVTVLKSLFLESFAQISIFCNAHMKTSNTYITGALKKSQMYANKVLYESPTSILAIKAISNIAKLLRAEEISLNDKQEEVFEMLSPNLSSSSHFLRLHTLTLLNTYPQRQYAISHNDIDFTGDLDEENSPTLSQDKVSKNSNLLSGNCDLIDTLLQIESAKIDMTSERILSSKISRVEILGRSKQLPVVYAEAVSYHMFGLMHIKYQPIWSCAIKALIAIACTHENKWVWSSIEKQLKLVMKESFFTEEVTTSKRLSTTEFNSKLYAKINFETYLKWDITNGNDATLFQHQILQARAQGHVCHHLTTDKITVFENVWKVLEGIPQITTKKSKVVVPIFLNFLHCQYYFYHDDDPDARELNLNVHVDGQEDLIQTELWNKETLGRKMLQKKLVSFLQMFSAVKGMTQLSKHELLFMIFVSLLSNPDLYVAKMALSCVTNFKVPYIMPYKEYLQGMMSKLQFRETLTKFDISREGGIVNDDHRGALLPVVTRILFGRLSARGSGKKSSKDSPAIRRAAILSFLSGLGRNVNEIDYFVYMMVRSFIPSSIDMQLKVDYGHNCRDHITDMIQKAIPQDLYGKHMHRLEGFLNLLSDVVKKLGFGIINFVPIFMELTLIIVEHVESQRKTNAIIPSSHNRIESIEEDYVNLKQNGKVRSLCFLRISDLMNKFATSFNFNEFNARLSTLLQPSLLNLSTSVINADKAPSLLTLLVTISSHKALLKFFIDESGAVEAIFKCISSQSKTEVVECALLFIDNLLTEGGTCETDDFLDNNEDRIGTTLVMNNIEMLVGQFTNRLEESGSNLGEYRPNNLLGRELSILCRVSHLLVHEEINTIERKEEVTMMMESLCKLLIPFLDFNLNSKESSQSDILGILKCIIPRIRKASALNHVQSFARLLGPNKSSSGMSSLEKRQNIIGCIAAIVEHDEDATTECLTKVVAALYDMAASNPKHIDECNFEKLLPVLIGLGKTDAEGKTWTYYTIPSNSAKNVNLDNGFDAIKSLYPLIFYCLHMLYDEDGVVSRGAFTALKVLVNTARHESLLTTHFAKNWKKLIESCLVPRLIVGLKTKDINVRRSFILLLGEVSEKFKSEQTPHFYGDLSSLIKEEDQNLDFFVNITHIQIHRRARALNRLRKVLLIDGECQFSTQSLSNVLLPLAMHPIYDYEKNSEESYALESIATVGAIMKKLPWGKYQNILWKILLELPRYERQERYFVALICAMVDAFHFSFDNDGMKIGSNNQLECHNNVILRQMNSRIIPKIENYLQKDTIRRNGKKGKSLRAPLVLALAILYRKMPDNMFESKLPRLLTVICNALADRDSNERELARNTLSKLAVSIGINYLGDIVRELAIALTEGYKLHVRAATLHSVLQSLSVTHVISDSSHFDQCIPAMMDIIQQDIFGQASEMKEAESVKKSMIKEAAGVKSYSSLETLSRMVLFKPSLHSNSQSTSFSSVHMLVNPFLQRIRDPEVHTKTIGKVKECLNRISIGVSQNSSVTTEEMLPFAYATVSPFVFKHKEDSDSSDISDTEEDLHEIEISTTNKSGKSKGKDSQKEKVVREVFEWAPSHLNTSKSTKSAYHKKVEQKTNLKRVVDGVNAPKLTGTSRYKALKSNGRDFNDPATSSAVSFALTLLNSHLKKMRLSKADGTMVDPFVRILTYCVRYSKDTSAILLSLKCLQVILRFELPSIQKYRKCLASHTLRILSISSQNTNDETVQSCFKTLTLLISESRKDAIHYLDESNENAFESKTQNEQSQMVLSDKQMQVLVSMLQAAIRDTEQHNATFSVIKAITSTQYVSAEYYDLMEEMLKMTVQGQQQSVRQQAAKIFLNYLIIYPMGKPRMENHLKQIVLNTKYEYESGRKSGLDLLFTVIQKLPVPLLEEYAKILFLPLVLQLVNDDSKDCRETVSKCLVALLKRLSTQILQSFFEYAERWASNDGADDQQLQRTSMQLFGIFLEARVDFMKKGDRAGKVITFINDCLEKELSSPYYMLLINGKEWEMTYFSLHTFENLVMSFPFMVRKELKLWKNVIKCLIHSHPWIKLVSSRIIYEQFSSAEPDTKESSDTLSILMNMKGSLFEIVRNICFQINSDEDQLTEEITKMAIKNLTWAISVMDSQPQLCYADNSENKLALDEETEQQLDGEIDEERVQDPVTWLITRLSNITKKRGPIKRETVFKCFAAFATRSKIEISTMHLELMLNSLDRVLSEIIYLEENSSRSNRYQSVDTSSDSDLVKEVMQMLEDICGTESYMNALSSVKSKAREKREARKQRLAAEAVHDPQAAANRKIAKYGKEKDRRKRRIQEHKAKRGVFTKKPRHISS